MSKRNAFMVLCTMAFLLSLLRSTGYCQAPATNQTFQKLLASADSILGIKGYTSNPPKAAELQKQLRGVLTRIEDSAPTLETAEERSLREIYITRLNRRNKAYQLVIDGKELPAKTATQAQELLDCIRLLEAYVADTSRSVFVDTSRSRDLAVQGAFLRQLAPCLSAFAKDESTLRQASALLTKMFIYKRVDLAQWLDLLENNPEAAKQLIAILMHKGNIETASMLLSEMIKAGADAQRLTELIHGMFAASDPQTLIRMFDRIVVEFGDDPEKMAWLRLQMAQAAMYDPHSRVLKPLLELMQRVQSEKLLANVFQLMLNTLPPDSASSEWQTAKAIQLIQDEIVQQAGDQFELSKRLNRLAEQAKALSEQRQDRKLRLDIATIWRSGNFQEPMQPQHYRAMIDQIKNALTADFIVSAAPESLPDTIKSKLDATLGEAVDSTVLAYLFQQRQGNRPDILVAGTYSYHSRNEPVALQLKMIDAETGIVLGVYDEKMKYDDDLNRFRANANDAATRLATAFQSELTAYLEFEIFAKTFSADAVDLNNFRSYLFYNAIFNLEPAAAFDSLRGLVVERIFIEDDFFATYQAGKRFTPFLAALQKSLNSAYPDLLPAIAAKDEVAKTSGQFLYIVGEQKQADSDWEMQVLIRRGYNSDVMTLHLKFRPNPVADAITQEQASYTAGFVTETVKSYLGFNQKYFTDLVEKKAETMGQEMGQGPISKWNALPSLLLPGSSQLIIADQIEPSLQKSTKRAGWGLFGISALLLGTAIVFDQMAIQNQNNDYLKIRNGSFAAIGVLGITSAILAKITINRHNSSNPKRAEYMSK